MNRKQLLFGFLTLAVVVCMVFAGEYSGEREIIFPEVTAIAVGLLLAPKQSWTVSKPRLFGLITLCAWAGLAFSLWLPGPLWCKLSVAFLFCQLVLLFSRTSFAPLISAGVLPVMLGTESIVYPIAAMAPHRSIGIAAAGVRAGQMERKRAFPSPAAPPKSRLAAVVDTVRCGNCLHFYCSVVKRPLCRGAAHTGRFHRICPAGQQGPANPSQDGRTALLLRNGRSGKPVFSHHSMGVVAHLIRCGCRSVDVVIAETISALPPSRRSFNYPSDVNSGKHPDLVSPGSADWNLRFPGGGNCNEPKRIPGQTKKLN